MRRRVILYGLAFAALAFVVEWLNFQFALRAWPAEIYIACVAVIFVALGIWVGNRLTARQGETFVRNDAAIKSLGISPREAQVLTMLATGHANKVIARNLNISPNTVKTHVAALFGKLDVSSRTQAICKARELQILP